MKRGNKQIQNKPSNAHDKHEVAPVEAVPVFQGHHKNQTISSQDNVAYGRVLPLQQNVAYEQAQCVFQIDY